MIPWRSGASIHHQYASDLLATDHLQHWLQTSLPEAVFSTTDRTDRKRWLVRGTNTARGTISYSIYSGAVRLCVCVCDVCVRVCVRVRVRESFSISVFTCASACACTTTFRILHNEPRTAIIAHAGSLEELVPRCRTSILKSAGKTAAASFVAGCA